MAKLKQSLLSLSASNTIGNALTFQKVGRRHIVRRKPVPTDRRTLAQMYQRWLYEDYVAWWNQQTSATKQTWESNARPYHMTGFAYWMSYHLKNLDDIVLGYRLDRLEAATTPDFSKNALIPVVTGCSLIPGAISNGFYFDGIDNKVRTPNSTPLEYRGAMSLECFYRTTVKGGVLFFRWDDVLNSFAFNIHGANGKFGGFFYSNLTAMGGWSLRDTTDGEIHHVCAQFNPSTWVRCYVDAVMEMEDSTNITALLNSTTLDLYLGIDQKDWWPHTGIIDHFVWYNRLLTPSDVLRHAERRYAL